MARIAGIMAAKRTSDLIPLCHQITLTQCSVDFTLLESEHTVETTCTTEVAYKTGVEMEALTGATVALLTIYDMCKAIDRGMKITQIQVVSKSGGESGSWQQDASDHLIRTES